MIYPVSRYPLTPLPTTILIKTEINKLASLKRGQFFWSLEKMGQVFYSATDLLTISEKPQKNQITLQTILEFYNEHLCNRIHVFELDNKSIPVIKLQFLPHHLCHLLGIHYIYKDYGNKYDYVGKSGYQLIKKGQMTFETLQKDNKPWFKSKRNRMLYFPFVYQLLQGPSIIEFNSDGLNTNLDVELIFYHQFNNTYLHLGLSKDPDSEFYYPKSFYERNDSKHIDNQKSITLKSVKTM